MPELPEVIRVLQARWMIVGPCLDGGYYAWPRGDDNAPRVLARDLDELATKIKERDGGS
ncbi:MAG: hypothetical protein ACRDNF_20750 [Streptosporangiaceae bacterium]